ncbi:MAG: hypothetical protein ACNA7V_10250 [Bacteroidales bacterium]
MKKIAQILLFSVFPLYVSAQSVSPEVIATAGDYFENSSGSLSWTLGEVMTETFSSGGNILTQGFQQPFVVRISLDLVFFLEGPYNGSGMDTWLNDASKIPLTQPYNTLPWNYGGEESVGSIPLNTVDWVLIELRDAISAPAANASTIIAQQAGFLMNDGSVISFDGSPNLQFGTTFHENLFIVVWHRNHLGIMSANPPSYYNGIYSYDFSSAASQVYGGSTGYKMMPSGTWVTPAGDGINDGIINILDLSLWEYNAGTQGYKSVDYNLDVQVNNHDKNDKWVHNQSYISTIP